MNVKNRAMSLVLALALLLSCIPASIFAATGDIDFGISFEKYDQATHQIIEGAVDEVKNGDVLVVGFSMTNNSGKNQMIASYDATLNYDKTVFSTFIDEADTGWDGPFYESFSKDETGSSFTFGLKDGVAVINGATLAGVKLVSGATVVFGKIAFKVDDKAEKALSAFSFDVSGKNRTSDKSETELTVDATAVAPISINGATPTLQTVTLDGIAEKEVHVNGTDEVPSIEVKAASAKGTDLTGMVNWEVVSGDKNYVYFENGELCVHNRAPAGEYTIKATPKDENVLGSAEAKLTVVRDSRAKLIMFVAKDSGGIPSGNSGSITIPGTGVEAKEWTLTAAVFDQFETGMNDLQVTFSYDNALDNVSGVTVNTNTRNTLSLTVPSAAATSIPSSQDFTITASYTDGSNINISNTFTLTIQRAAAEVKSVEINGGAATIAVPTKAEAPKEIPYTATVQDQYGSSTGNAVTWDLKDAPDGVEIDQTGKVTVKTAAVDSPAFYENQLTFYVTATCGTVTKEKAVVLTRDAYEITYMEIDGADALEILTDKNNTAEYTVVDGKDQYGGGMTVPADNVEWSISPADISGVSINKNTGELTVTKDAAEKITTTAGQEFTITARYTTKVFAQKTITVKRAESVATSLTVAQTSTAQGPFVVPGRDASDVYIDFTATVLDQYGSAMQNQNVTWSILQGTTVLENDNKIMSIFDGRVNVANAAKQYVSGIAPVTFTVMAELGGLSNTAEFQLKRAASVLDSFNLYKREGTNGEFTLVSQDMIVVPSDDTAKTFQYMAKPVDQYGAEMSTDVAYTLKLTRTKGSVSEPVDGLSFDADTKIGTLTVTKTSPTTKTETLEIGIHAANDKNTFYNVTFSHKDPANVTVADTLDLTYGDERGITATVEGTGANAKWTWTSSDTSVITASGNTTAATLHALKAGNATVTVTYEDDSRYGTATIEVTVAKKTLTVSAGSYKLSKQYTGKTAGVHGSGELQVNGLVNGDKASDVIYIFTTQFPTANAGSGEMDVKVKVYSSGAGDWKDKYQLEAASAEDGTVLVKVPYTITPAPLTIGTGSFKSRPYDPANNSAEVETLALKGAVGNDKLVLGTDYEVTEVRVSNNNVGTQRVSFKVTLKNSNYKWTADAEHVCEVPESAGFTVEITKAPHENATASGSAKYGNTAVVDISSYLPTGYHIGIITTGGDLSVFSNWELGESTFSVSLANNPANVGKQVTFTLPISSTNYASFDLVITVTVNDKLENSLAANDIYLTYGDTGYVTVTSIIGSLQTEIVSGEDVISLDNGTIKTLKAGTATLKLTASGDENYAEKSIQVKVTVSPKPITLTIDSKSAYVNDAQPALTYKVNGLVGSDVLTTVPALFVDVAEGVDPMKQVGTYAIKTSVTPSAGDNYSLTVAEGTLSVTNRPSAITPVGPSAGTVRVDETEGGTVRVTPANAAEGSTVTIVVTPDQGQELRSLEVLDKDGDSLELTDLGGGRFSFEMPRGKVTVKAEFGKAGLPYHDVKEGDWFYSAVEYVTEAGLMGDTGHGSFEPNTNTTRAMIWAILARLSGVDTTPVSGPWYSVAQEWAMNSGVSDGTNPNGAITREQLVTMLYRYAETHGIDVTEGGMAIREFADVESVSSFAGPAMTWAVNTGLISGIDGKLVPQGLATRSQVATVLMRFAQLAK